ncbi:hypothetical protein [Luteimonas sp. MC1825]|uniref:hypothetical protein n=1 Tax=Luteimonas sp. MC1825 TaxID=2761107 RepID=UPI00161836B7|nr:hypothetical protein [Luteimonas sp. MC1825]MBB6600293.1 hypothetical protein [Luteimonas sp. MC1825]QOC87973.1 hypothetical protein IDM46_12245 [Luteimonas sp. MC1825]
MHSETNRLAKATKARRTKTTTYTHLPPSAERPSRSELVLEAVDLSHPEMERRMRPQRVWEFLDEGKSKFYARMDVDDASYDPLFPKPIPSSSNGTGHKRWKLGAVIAWLRHCEAAAKNS